MSPFVSALTTLFAAGTVLLQGVIVVGFIGTFVFRYRFHPFLTLLVVRHGVLLAGVLAVVSLFMSLWYSKVVGLPVCELCWYARTMMYPLAFLLPIAAYYRDQSVARYVVPLASLGAAITLLHHLYQVGAVSITSCDISGISCATRYVYEFGFVTMPLMGLTVFLAIILLTLASHRG